MPLNPSEDLRDIREVISSKDQQQIDLWSLVLSAVAIPHLVRHAEEELRILVEADNLHRAQHELYLFTEESRFWPPKNQELYKDKHHYQPPTLLIIMVLAIFFSETGPVTGQTSWFTQGGMSSSQVLDHGQWWRLVTALTLHSDINHLLGNMAIGGLITHLLTRIIGLGLGWLLIISAGTFGNLLNAWFHQGPHNSIGFSTAVFGAIGISSGLEIIRRKNWQGVIAGLGAGLGLLAMLNGDGSKVDIGAHFWGFFVGIFFGIGTAFFRNINGNYPSLLAQIPMTLASIWLVYFAWFKALETINPL